MRSMTINDVERIEYDATIGRFHFVCTAQEFCRRYGVLDKRDIVEFGNRINAVAVVCKDGMIRPR